MREWHRNWVANVINAAKKSFDFLYSDEVIENIFSNIEVE